MDLLVDIEVLEDVAFCEEAFHEEFLGAVVEVLLRLEGILDGEELLGVVAHFD